MGLEPPYWNGRRSNIARPFVHEKDSGGRNGKIVVGLNRYLSYRNGFDHSLTHWGLNKRPILCKYFQDVFSWKIGFCILIEISLKCVSVGFNWQLFGIGLSNGFVTNKHWATI